MPFDREARDIEVFGIVQGVGFRPFVYRLARELGLSGWVKNTSGDVTIHVEGAEDALDRFRADLVMEAPPLAQIERVSVTCASLHGYSAFTIDVSEQEGGRYQPVSPDVAMCLDCQQELLEPTNRRYGYPFTNCTNCGPRFTIIEKVPYDRANTTMKSFTMCPECRAEYENPEDRRFHAQPTACPVCGPHVWLESDGMRHSGTDQEVLKRARDLLLAGQVLAIKGLGGFHLAVDATNDTAVARLRQRKQRPHKALALMMADLAMVRQYCLISPQAQAALTSPASPIVLLPPCVGSGLEVSDLIAPDNDKLGVMLPYTPLHHLLLQQVQRPLVMTSGNLSEEPLATDNDEARMRLGHIADAFLMHDRPIYMPCDDSVVSLVATEAAGKGERHQVMRRARGYVPFPLHLPTDGPQVLAVGPELKCTICVVRDRLAFLSQHIGDLSNLETWEHYQRVVRQFEELFNVKPEIIAHDLHPDYMSTNFALERAARDGVVAVGVQHHYAHALSCLAEAGIDPRSNTVQAVVFDGTGYGSDGCIWGGEWLLVHEAGFQRLAHLQYMPLAGGEAGIEHVDRLAAGYLLAGGEEALLHSLPVFAGMKAGELDFVRASLVAPTAVPCSSMGRLFDVVAGMLGLTRQVGYEAQAAVRLETLARKGEGSDDQSSYCYEVGTDGSIGIVLLLREIANDIMHKGEPAQVALKFHQTISSMVARVCADLAARTGTRRVALSGGCFQNSLLTDLCMRTLIAVGLTPIIHSLVPCNDGGVALGQAVAARLSQAQGA